MSGTYGTAPDADGNDTLPYRGKVGAELPRVLDGASDLLIDVFGEDRGTHARAALYQHELARDAPVAGQVLLAVRPE